MLIIMNFLRDLLRLLRLFLERWFRTCAREGVPRASKASGNRLAFQDIKPENVVVGRGLMLSAESCWWGLVGTVERGEASRPNGLPDRPR